MPPNNPPPPQMTWAKASPVLGVCAFFWGLRVLFESLVFTAPFLAGAVSAAWVKSYLGGGFLANGLAAGAGVIGGYATSWIDPIILVFGIVMATVIGFAGWMGVSLLISLTNIRIFKEESMTLVWLLFGLGGSVIPFLDLFPNMLGSVFALYRGQIKRDKARHARWLAEQTPMQTLYEQGEQASQQAAVVAQAQARAVERKEQKRAEETMHGTQVISPTPA